MQSNCEKSGGSKNMELLKHLKLLKLSVDIRKFHKFQYFHKLLNIYVLNTPLSNHPYMAWKEKNRLITKKQLQAFPSKWATNLSQMSN